MRPLARLSRALPALNLLGLWLLLAGCSSEPCQHTDAVDIDPQATPFAGGQSVFSQCDTCPALPQQPGVEDSGAATLCSVGFNDEGRSSAWVGCFYGPGGRTSSSIANDAVTDVPNLFDYCKAHCPERDALHSCTLSADASGVQRFSCTYGRACD